jgi:hypothetical protein
MFEFESGTLRFLPSSLFHLENHVFLSHDVLVASVTWRAAMRIVAGVGDLLQRIRDGHTGRVLGGRTVERLDDTVHHAHGDEERGFFA